MRVRFDAAYDEPFKTIVSKRAVDRIVNASDKIESVDTGDKRISSIWSKLVQDEKRGPHFTVVMAIDEFPLPYPDCSAAL